jgi:ribose transport system substrate-binding protein
MRLYLLPVVMVAAATVFLGCEKTESAGDSSSDGRRKVVIGLVAKSQSNQVFQAAHAGARDAAKELGDRYNCEIEIDIRTPPDEDATRQAEAIEALTRRGVDGIAISCSEANTVTPSIDKAVARGIPVICFDSDAPASQRFAYYGTDDATCGKAVMQELATAMGGVGTIAILAGNQSAPNLQARLAGVRAELKNHPNIQELNDGNGVFYHQETPEKAAEAVMNAQNANPQITGWAFIGGWPLFTADALRWSPGSIKVVSVDALPAELNYLRSGHVEVLLAQDCYGWGTRSVEILLDRIIHDKTPESVRVIDPLTRVTRDNADEYARKWDRWLGK